ncbi:transporter substrate-binding domain-containing protein [Desulfovibrio inopinatus]|uniref:transporter substrate-binding domain-containing protein n=1 Tax=Desulfovibrio inopinatus TaxID=102109 RepID=UPI00042959E5|nr:transporter substrate-binding domain-containing protein [Desulfovibrio inopinatus]
MIVLALLLVISSLTSPGYAQETLVFNSQVTNRILGPQCVLNADNVLKEALESLGYSVKFIQYPPLRSLMEVDSGHIDGESTLFEYNAKRFPNIVRVKEAVLEDMPIEAFMIKPPPFNPTPGPAVFGYVRGLFDPSPLVGHDHVVETDSGESLFALLAKGRIDVAVFCRDAGLSLGQHLKIEGFTVVAHIAQVDVYVALNKRHADLAKSLSQVLLEMKHNGRYKTILSNENDSYPDRTGHP